MERKFYCLVFLSSINTTAKFRKILTLPLESDLTCSSVERYYLLITVDLYYVYSFFLTTESIVNVLGY